MPIKVTCPKCDGVLHAPDDASGKRGRCPTCGTVLNIPADGPRSAAPVASSPPGDHPFRPGDAGPKDQPGAMKAGKPGSFGFADVADPPRSAAGAVPAPAFHPPESRRTQSPSVTRASLHLPGSDDEPTDVAARGWQRVRRGLGWVRTGTVFLVLAVVALAAVVVVNDKAPGTLPDKNPGYLNADNLSAVQEIMVAAGAVPALLGVLAIMIGRAGVAKAPRSSFTRGLAKLSVLGTLIAFVGLVAAAGPAVLLVSEGIRPEGLANRMLYEGVVQRFGLAAVVGCTIAAEVWFVVALGKIGAALHQRRASARRRPARRPGRVDDNFCSGSLVGYKEYSPEVSAWLATNVTAKWNQLGGDQVVVVAGAAALVAVVAGTVYLRMVGGDPPGGPGMAGPASTGLSGAAAGRGPGHAGDHAKGPPLLLPVLRDRAQRAPGGRRVGHRLRRLW